MGTTVAEIGVLSDETLIERSAREDRSAFTILVSRHERSLRCFCRSILKDDAAAADAAQDVLLDVWKQRNRFRPDGSFKAFLYTIARNRCRSIVRWRMLRTFVAIEDVNPTVGDASVPFLRSERQRIVYGALDRLPENFRTPLVLRFIDGLSFEEIATVIGRTSSAARSRVFYGLKKLAEELPSNYSLEDLS